VWGADHHGYIARVKAALEALRYDPGKLEVVIGGKALVPFVGDYSPGSVEGKISREVRTVKTPRMRPKLPFRAPELLDVRAPGENAYLRPGESREQAMERLVAMDMDNLKGRVETTIEWMCAQAVKGTLSYAGDEVAFSIDYRMPAEHKIVLGSGAKWTDTGVDPLEDLEDWADLILEATGLTPNVCVHGKNAWNAFRNNAKVQESLETRRVEGARMIVGVGDHFKGQTGNVDHYRYGGTYQDSAGTAQKLLDEDYVVFACTQAETEIQFGLPEDLEAGGMSMEYFAKAWLDKDPSVLWELIESRPLPLPKQPDAFIYAKVV